jgi:hypothetical protein
MSTFAGNIITATRDSKIKTDAKPLDFGSLNPKAMTSVSALSGTNGAWTGIITDPPSENGGSQSLIVQRARKELIQEGDSSRELKGGSHLEKVAKVYTLEAETEIHLKSSGTIVIEAERVSLVGSGGFIDINGGVVSMYGQKINLNCSGCVPAQGTLATPAPPDAAG